MKSMRSTKEISPNKTYTVIAITDAGMFIKKNQRGFDLLTDSRIMNLKYNSADALYYNREDINRTAGFDIIEEI